MTLYTEALGIILAVMLCFFERIKDTLIRILGINNIIIKIHQLFINKLLIMGHRKLWIALALVVGASFAVLLYYGNQIYQTKPPTPEQVVDKSGKVLFTGQDILDGMNIWQSIGGQQVGSIWGHGAYVAPDWNADYLHREAQYLLNKWAGGDFASVSEEEKAALERRLQLFLRENTNHC